MTRTAVRPLMLGAVAVVLLFAWLGTVQSPARDYSLDALAQRHVDRGLRRALLTFATARTLEGILSVAQASAIAVEPAGIGVQLSPGQALRPLNDLVGQFAELTLMASIAFGAMDILLRIGSHWAVSLALSVAAVGWAAHRWRSVNPPPRLTKALVVLLLFRFAVPVVSLANEGIYAAFMADSYADNQRAIEATSVQLEEAPPAKNDPRTSAKSNNIWDWVQSRIRGGSDAEAKAKAEPGMLDRLREWVAQKGDVGTRLKNLVQAGENLTERIVRLMVVFVLQTLVIPLLLAWALVRGTAAFLQVPTRSSG
jgi:hypothetical protein